MKTRIFFIGMFAIMALFSFVSCENSLLNQDDQDYGILPSHFKVDIPSSLSNNLKSAELKSTTADSLNGNVIYWYLNAYIAVGEGAADIVEAIMWSIRLYHIEDVISLTYTSNDDNRVKNLDVVADVEFEGRQWEYQLTITDAESEGNDDGGIGMQVFWSKHPVEGIAIIKPYNLDRNKHANWSNSIGRILYSEKMTDQYDATMIVEMAGLPVVNTFEVNAMKMFVGRRGDVIDVIGNSSHPKARFNIYDETRGYNWAFVASGDDEKNIAVAEVGLPYSSENLTSRQSILEEYSIKSVLTREMTNFVVAAWAEAGITLVPEEIENYVSPYLSNADAPGYFNSSGFVKGGTAPNDNYSEFEDRLQLLAPYNPAEIANLSIDFKY
jgi:hypothetical protein